MIGVYLLSWKNIECTVVISPKEDTATTVVPEENRLRLSDKANKNIFCFSKLSANTFIPRPHRSRPPISGDLKYFLQRIGKPGRPVLSVVTFPFLKDKVPVAVLAVLASRGVMSGPLALTTLPGPLVWEEGERADQHSSLFLSCNPANPLHCHCTPTSQVKISQSFLSNVYS